MAAATVIGCTGLVGGRILSNLLELDDFASVQTISRREPKCKGPKLQAIIESDTAQWVSKFSALPVAPSTVFSGLGTTSAQAGGVKNQWLIDHDLNVEFAKAAKKAGTKTFVFVSSGGTRGPLSSLVPYSMMKQGVEDNVRKLEFEHAIILRPGLIIGEREHPRLAETMVKVAVDGLGRIFGQRGRDAIGQEADVIAKAAIHAAKLASEGKAPEKYWVLGGADIVRLGRTEWKPSRP